MTKFKVGDKVVPISKSMVAPLEQSKTWKRAKEKNQPFLYIVHIQPSHISCNWNKDDSFGDMFLESDLVLYKEEEAKFREGELVYVSDISIENAFSNKRARIYQGSVRDIHYCLDQDSKTYTDASCLIRWKYIVKIPPKITSINMNPIGGHGVQVYKDKVIVGCTTVSRKVAEEIMENMNLLSKD